MYHFTYGEIVEDAGTGSRERERLALDKSIGLLREASETGGGNKAVLEALIYVRRLWAILLEDLAQPGNDLPVKLRADLISIGVWIMKEADRVRDDQSRSLKGLIDVSSMIRDETQMKRLLRIYLQPGEKIFVNGAVIRVDRKVSLELLNDVTFLLESHVLQAEDANTPLKQLYFVLQTILMDPSTTDQVLVLFKQMHAALIQSFENPDILSDLKFIDGLVAAEKYFEALKCLRGLFAGEERILGPRGKSVSPQPSPQQTSTAEMVA